MRGSARFKSMCGVHPTSKLRCQCIVRSPADHHHSGRSTVHIITVQTVVQSFVVRQRIGVRMPMLYSSAIAVAICRQARTLKLSFDFSSWSREQRSKSRHPRPEPVLHTSMAVLGQSPHEILVQLGVKHATSRTGRDEHCSGGNRRDVR